MSPRILCEDLTTKSIVDWAVPLTGAETTDTLSGPRGLGGSLPAGYHVDLQEWRHALWVEDEGQILGGGIVTTVEHSETDIQVDCSGFTYYPNGMPWLAPREDLIQIDPLDIVRKIWDHLQAQHGGNLYVTVDPLTSPVRVGEPEEDVEFETSEGEDVAFEAGPFRLNSVDTLDLQKTLDDLASETPFDYREESFWHDQTIAHRLVIGYPTLGARRQERVHTTENLASLPTLTMDGEDYASEVLVIGAGEGREAITAHVPSPPKRLRRVATVTDKSLRSKSAATNAARADLAARTADGEITELVLRDHPHLRLNTIAPGDEFHVTGPLYTGEDLNTWVRVVSITQAVETPSQATLEVVTV